MNVQIGDRVKILPHCEHRCDQPHCTGANHFMIDMAGKETYVTYKGLYHVTFSTDKGAWAWSPCMFIVLEDDEDIPCRENDFDILVSPKHI